MLEVQAHSLFCRKTCPCPRRQDARLWCDAGLPGPRAYDCKTCPCPCCRQDARVRCDAGLPGPGANDCGCAGPWPAGHAVCAAGPPGRPAGVESKCVERKECTNRVMLSAQPCLPTISKRTAILHRLCVRRCSSVQCRRAVTTWLWCWCSTRGSGQRQKVRSAGTQ